MPDAHVALRAVDEHGAAAIAERRLQARDGERGKIPGRKKIVGPEHRRVTGVVDHDGHRTAIRIVDPHELGLALAIRLQAMALLAGCVWPPVE